MQLQKRQKNMIAPTVCRKILKTIPDSWFLENFIKPSTAIEQNSKLPLNRSEWVNGIISINYPPLIEPRGYLSCRLLLILSSMAATSQYHKEQSVKCTTSTFNGFQLLSTTTHSMNKRQDSRSHVGNEIFTSPIFVCVYYKLLTTSCYRFLTNEIAGWGVTRS